MILSLSRALERPLSISSCLFCFHGLTIYLYPKETDCHHIHLRDDAILALTPISVFDVPGQCHCRLADSSCYIYRQASFSVAVPSSGNNVQVPLRSRSGFPISIRPPASSIYHRPTPKKKKKTNRLPPWRHTIPDYRITRMPVTRDSNIHRALHLDAITIAIAIAIRRPRIMQLRNNAQIPLRIRPRFRSRPIIQVHILLVDPRPGSIRRG